MAWTVFFLIAAVMVLASLWCRALERCDDLKSQNEELRATVEQKKKQTLELANERNDARDRLEKAKRAMMDIQP